MPYNSSQDPFTGATKAVTAQARGAVAVTPHDTNDLATYPKALWIGADGNIVVIPVENADNAPVTFAVSQGVLPVQVRRVLATGTTATGIVALY